MEAKDGARSSADDLKSGDEKEPEGVIVLSATPEAPTQLYLEVPQAAPSPVSVPAGIELEIWYASAH